MSLCIEKALSGRFRLMESPWLDFPFEEFVNLGSGATKTPLSVLGEHTPRIKKIIGRKNSLSSLGDQKPHPNCKGETNASIEPARLQVPVPFIRVNHMWRKLTHDYSCNCCRCGSKPCSIGPQSLRGYFSNITPAGCAVRC